MSVDAELAEKYLSILRNHDLAQIYGQRNAYSGIFLPSVGERYEPSGVRTMIVGKETLGWRNKTCNGKLKHRFELEDVIASQEQHAKVLVSLGAKSKFIQFYRSACKRLNDDKKGDSIVWANLLCVSDHSKSPVGSKAFEAVKALSKDLLIAQIEVLQPSVILFVTGTSYDKYIREFFPDRQASVALCPGKLWSFRIGNSQCFRTSHPQWSDGGQYRDRALALAKAGSFTAQP